MWVFIFRAVFLLFGWLVSRERGNHVSAAADDEIHEITLSGAIANKTLNVSYPTSSQISLNVFNMKGLSTTLSDPLFSFGNRINEIAFYGSAFDLYDEKGALVGPKECNDAEYFARKDLNYFSNFEDRDIFLMLNQNDLKAPKCPYVFKNARIRDLTFSNYGNTKLYRNVFSFYQIENSTLNATALNSRIAELNLIYLFYAHLSGDEFSREVFAFVTMVTLTGKLSLIEDNFFRTFDRLATISIMLDNAEQFFHASYNEWLASIFFQLRQFETKKGLSDYMNSSLQSTDTLGLLKINQFTQMYSFPDEDFCLYRHFPRFKMLISSIYVLNVDPGQLTNSDEVSCTYKFLSESNNIYSKFPDPSWAFFNDNLLKKCAFDERLSMCSTDNFKLESSRSPIDYLDMYYALDWIEFVGPIITFPIFAALAFVLNLLVILIIRSKKNKKEKLFLSKSFRFIEMNSAFNCIECFIYQLRLLGLCMGANSVFCSPVRFLPGVFYLGVASYYLSETMKSCSMISGLYFSIQRYIDTSQTKNERLKSFSRIKTSRLFLGALAYGLLISSPELFNIEYDYTFSTYDVPTLNYIEIQLFERQRVATYFHFTHYVLNDFVILVANIVVDSFLVREIKMSLRKKLINRKNLADHSDTGDKCDKKKRSIERKANTMIIISIVIYFFCRLPELISTFYLYYYYVLYGYTKCSGQVFCPLVSNTVEYLYMLSYIFNIFLYLKFNTYFYKGFRNFFGMKSSIL